MRKLKALEKLYDKGIADTNDRRHEITQVSTHRIRPDEQNPRHLEDFNKLLARAVKGKTTAR